MTVIAVRHSPGSRLALGLTLGTAVVLAACGSTASPSPSVQSTGGASSTTSVPSTQPSQASSAKPATSAKSATAQTDTDWGLIWDTLPTGFPTYPGATPSEEASTSAASATLVVTGNVAKGVATSMQTQLEAAGYRTEGLDGPLENGGYVLDSVGSPDGCQVQVTAAPLGGVTTVTIMYGAACPHD